MILTLSGQRAAGGVRCAHAGLGDRDLFTWTHRRTPSSPVRALRFAEQPKNMPFPVAISVYLGAIRSDRDVGLSDTAATCFVPVRGALHAGPGAVSQQRGAVCSLNHSSPVGHTQHMFIPEFILLCALFALTRRRLRLPRRR